MPTISKIIITFCAAMFIFGSCSSSKQASKQRRKRAPCDCPKFNYIPSKTDPHIASVINTSDITTQS